MYVKIIIREERESRTRIKEGRNRDGNDKE
jgi:hypothetical protein